MGMNGDSVVRSDGNEKHAAASDRGAPGRSAWLRAGPALRLGPLGAPPRRIARSVIRDGSGGEASLGSLGIGCTSRRTANFGQWDGPIRKNIIGHRMRPGTWHGSWPGTWHGMGRGMAVRGKQAFARGVFRNARRAFALLDQPSGEHGAAVFFHPLIEQSANLFAEIGGVGKTRKFVALKRITRSREKEFPRRLGWGTGHVSLLSGRVQSITSVINVHSTESALTVEICGKLFGQSLMPGDAASGTLRGPRGMTACSACAGDYEDPERTAWEAEVNDHAEEASVLESDSKGFPVEK